MNAAPEVRRHVGPLLAFEQAAAWLLNYQDDLDRYGYGHGYATEGEPAALRGIGMTTDPAEDFDPDADEGPFRRHVLYGKLRDPDN
jgi:hypothetical protein